ncbi:magnesium transporter MRS2 homolog, mitochondrial isoform X3 [Mobula birostris]|uniref:magnesium transporter MRS2 homolog, mitochondrial isoform X3 n=1 Tax=Mobula birostris TaxID=1983395 RepID=UPI003B28DC0D
MEVCGALRSFLHAFRERAGFTLKSTPAKLRCFKHGFIRKMSKHCGGNISALHICVLGNQPQLFLPELSRHFSSVNGQHSLSKDSSQTTLGSVVPVFSVVKYESTGNISFFERKKTELYQELGLQARDLRFQHSTSINIRNNCIILRMEILKAVITPEYLLILDDHQSDLEHWLLKDLTSQLAGDGQLATYSLPFEFRAIEAILQHRPLPTLPTVYDGRDRVMEDRWEKLNRTNPLKVEQRILQDLQPQHPRINALQASLNELQPQILETLEALVNPKQMSVDRSKLHILLQGNKNLSGLETDIKVFKEALLEILDEEKLLKELCLSRWSENHVFDQGSTGIDLTEEMELLLENYYRQAEDLANTTRELKVLIDDSESIIFINLDRACSCRNQWVCTINFGFPQPS